MNTKPNIEEQILNQLEQSEKEEESNPFKCPHRGCNKAFRNASGLRMHNARVHTKTLGSGYNWKAKLTKSHRLERRREYQRKLRERYKREGKDSRGYPKKGLVWSDERRAKFMSTIRAKNSQRLQARKRYRSDTPEYKRQKYLQQKARQNIRYAYPLPEQQAAPQGPAQSRDDRITNCPYCGHNIERHL